MAGILTGRTALVTGGSRGIGRAIAIALAAEGETEISEISHIDRGYEDIARDLRALGADISRRDP